MSASAPSGSSTVSTRRESGGRCFQGERDTGRKGIVVINLGGPL